MSSSTRLIPMASCPVMIQPSKLPLPSNYIIFLTALSLAMPVFFYLFDQGRQIYFRFTNGRFDVKVSGTIPDSPISQSINAQGGFLQPIDAFFFAG